MACPGAYLGDNGSVWCETHSGFRKENKLKKKICLVMCVGINVL